ncbi:TauD/TfdA family dioxygenase [Streptomyces chartreusis]|uniref:TauD/TfdA family dioxygenase n=1 Tax=Streptomyces chartreusis TaxID=1969 RepID=UPI0033CFF728
MTGLTHLPALPEVSLAETALEDLGARTLPTLLDRTGALLIRDAGISSATTLVELATALGLSAQNQLEPFAARRFRGHGVWSQPAWPNTSPMCMHHELGWQQAPPPYLLIACLRPAASGGRTGVADGRAVLPLLPAQLVKRADRHGWSMVRRYADSLIGMPWQEAFPGLDTAAVEAYAATEGIELEWSADGLATRRHRPAVRTTGPDRVPAWSNLLAFCSEWTMAPPVREYLISALGRQGLPFETAFGDGSPFTAADVEAVNTAYDQATVYVDWRAGDVLLLDNIRTAHSVEPFTGEREMAVLHAAPLTPAH